MCAWGQPAAKAAQAGRWLSRSAWIRTMRGPAGIGPGSAPDFARHLDDALELRLLLVDGELVAALAARGLVWAPPAPRGAPRGGEGGSWSSGRNFDASSMRRFSSSLLSSAP